MPHLLCFVILASVSWCKYDNIVASLCRHFSSLKTVESERPAPLPLTFPSMHYTYDDCCTHTQHTYAGPGRLVVRISKLPPYYCTHPVYSSVFPLRARETSTGRGRRGSCPSSAGSCSRESPGAACSETSLELPGSFW